MVADVFQKILQDAARRGIERTGGQAREWFRDQAKKVVSVNSAEMLRQSKDRYRQSVTPGHMYMYYYDPKHKDTLPYYDRFPLIFPLDFKVDRFLGINLHYLPYKERAQLMDALYTVETGAWGKQRKLKISYDLLKSAAKFKGFKPCIKSYLKAHVRSRFVKVLHEEWDMALMLPLEHFEKATKHKVWRDSLEKMRMG